MEARYTEAMHSAELGEVNYIGSPKQSKIDYNVVLKGQLILNMLSTTVCKEKKHILLNDSRAHCYHDYSLDESLICKGKHQRVFF